MKLNFYRWRSTEYFARPKWRPEWTARITIGRKFVEGYGMTRARALISALRDTFARPIKPSKAVGHE